ncbi:Acetyltransferase (GNAT) family protein [Roseibium album]|nr:Acetyltransferase (GNAT) family protein [Roseibium album]
MVAIRTVHLEDLPSAVEQIQKWYLHEWPAWYGPGGPGDAQSDLVNCVSTPGKLPKCLVAIDDRDQLLGTASLKFKSPGSDQYPGAWLTALLVPSKHRGSGIGTALVAAAECEAKHLTFSSIHASTTTAHSLLKRNGWAHIDAIWSSGIRLEIYRKLL